jgi:hypothetical protein
MYGTNSSTLNYTQTSIIANASLLDVNYNWTINCTDLAGNTGGSIARNISIVSAYINITSIIVDDTSYALMNQIDLVAGSTQLVYCNMTIRAPGVYTDILGVNATFFSSTTTIDAADNNRTHYSNSSCTFLTGGGDTADYQCAFNVWHFAINGTWNCTSFAWDSVSTSNNSDNTTVNQLFALNISTELIDYANLQPNATSSNVTVNISNVGNMPMNISVYGFGGDDNTTGAGLSMICQINNISVSFEKFSTNATANYDSKTSLLSSEVDLGLTIPAKDASDDVRVNSTYWQFMVPPESHTFGQCNGSVVFVAETP